MDQIGLFTNTFSVTIFWINKTMTFLIFMHLARVEDWTGENISAITSRIWRSLIIWVNFQRYRQYRLFIFGVFTTVFRLIGLLTFSWMLHLEVVLWFFFSFLPRPILKFSKEKLCSKCSSHIESRWSHNLAPDFCHTNNKEKHGRLNYN